MTGGSPPRGRDRILLGLAVALLVAMPLVPGAVASPAPSALTFVRIPVESVAVLLVLAVVPWRPARIVVAGVFGALVVAAGLLAGLDRGYESVLAVPFDPADAGQLGAAYGVLADAIGAAGATALVVLAGLVVVGLATALAWAALRTDAAMRRRRGGPAALAAACAVWIVGALLGSQAAAAASVDTLGDAVSQASAAVADSAAWARRIADDPYAGAPASSLLQALRGKDVVIAFVESYGQVAVQGSAFSTGVDDVLRRGTAQLSAEGYGARSAWLTSPTFGGLSWLAHSTLQAGVWTDTQARYDQLIATHRLTLSDAFRRAGWRTVSDVPSDTRPWPPGTSFYHYGTLLDAGNVGYRGPAFGYARIPDEYTWKYFADHELAGKHPPVMAEIDLVSSHAPWAPLPQPVPWSQIGDGSVYDPQPAQSTSAQVVWRQPRTVQAFYGRSVEYSLDAMLSFLRNVHDPNLVVIVLGDHQPAAIVSGAGAGHDVPVSIIARDPAVLHRIDGWQWQSGLLPGADAPTWRMDAFRDRFLATFGP